MLVNPLLRWNDVGKLAQFHTEKPSPSQIDVSIKAHAFVLSEHQHLAQSAVETIRQGKIDNAIDSAEWYSRLCAIAGQRFKPGSLSSGQNNRQDVIHIRLSLILTCVEKERDVLGIHARLSSPHNRPTNEKRHPPGDAARLAAWMNILAGRLIGGNPVLGLIVPV